MMNPQVPTVVATPAPTEPQPPAPPVPKTNWAISILFLILGILIGLGGFWAYQKYLPYSSNQPINYSSPSPAATPDPTANWKTFTDSVLGIEYKLPSKLGLLEMSGKEIAGDTGRQYCAIYMGSLSFSIVKPVLAGSGPCAGGVFTIGSVSRDYSAGREGGFGDFTGYIIKNSLYYPRFINSQSQIALPPNLISEKTNANGVKYLKVTGQNSMQDRAGEQMDIPIPGTPGRGYLGVLINTNNKTYAGFNIQLEIKSPSDEATLDQILSTFKFLPQGTGAMDSTKYNGWTDYRGKLFTFKYPEHWTASGPFVIRSQNPEILIAIAEDPTMMNECMQQTSVKNQGGLVLRTFQGVPATGEACSGSGPSQLEIWIVKNADSYGPGIQISYSANNTQAATIVQSIIDSFKFTQ